MWRYRELDGAAEKGYIKMSYLGQKVLLESKRLIIKIKNIKEHKII